jgi:hypothetical protein
MVLVGGLAGSAEPPAAAGFLAETPWPTGPAGARHGGYSAIEVSEGGTRFLALSDRGFWVEGRLVRDAEGRISGVEEERRALLLATGTAPLRRGRGDSEGLALSPDGTVHVSFEVATRVLRYARIDGPAENLPIPQAFRAMQRNAALEALAVAPDGTLYAIPERTGPAPEGPGLFARYRGSDDGADFPVWRFRAGVWDTPFALPRRGPFLPVAADFGPDGRLFVLERAFHGPAGFAARVRVLTLGPRGIVAEETLLETPPGRHDNLEGMSVWQDAAGALRLTLIADDNFSLFQRTELVEYRFAR